VATVAVLMVLSLSRVASLSLVMVLGSQVSVIPGWSEGPDPESRDSPMCNCTSRFDAEPVIGPRFARTRWHRPGMTASVLQRLSSGANSHRLDPSLRDHVPPFRHFVLDPLSHARRAVADDLEAVVAQLLGDRGPL